MRIDKFVLAVAFAACGLGIEAAKRPLLVQDETFGVSVVPPEENTWRSRGLDMYRRHTADDLRALPGEFFELEYGKSVAAFAFTNGWSRQWGASKNDVNEPGVRFGRGWGDYVMCQWAIVADVEQDVPKSQWMLYTYTARQIHSKRLTFGTGAAGRTTVTIPMGMFRMPSPVKGFKLVCSDTNAVKGVVHALRFVATELPVAYRRRFTLKEKPAFAGVSFPGCPHSDLYLNGRLLWHGINVRGGGGVLRQAIADRLVVGENEIVFTKDAGAGWGVSTGCALEIFTVDEQGRTTVVDSTTGWECRYGDGEWKPAKVGSLLGVHRLFNGKPYQNGQNPMHAGALQVKPKALPFPVFDADRPIEWEIWHPAGVKEAKVTAVVRDAFTGAALEGTGRAGSFPAFAFPPGAYEVEWTLTSGASVVDRVKSEMVVCGPLGLKEFEKDEIEPYLARHKRLVWSADPTDERWMSVSSNFIGHTGMFAAPRVDMGRVVTEAGRKVRLTGDSDGAYFAWRIDVGRLGAPHIVEIDYPDTREQVINSTIAETYPYDFCNNGSPYDRGQPNATGSVRTGNRAPLSGRIQTLRYVFFPGSRNSTVTFESGLVGKPAACAAIRIYELDAPLPAWRLPKTDRIFMNHSERPLFGIWGAWHTPIAYSSAAWGAHEPRRWAGAYAACVNRIQQLKFEGHNASVEGVYMYMNGFPTFNGESNEAHESYDFAYLIAKMYRANGIKFFAGFEYLASPKLGAQGAYDVSERDLWAGKGKSPSHLVDKDGRITVGFGGMGLDDGDPIVRTSLTNLLSAIYRRYDGLGVAGLFVISGGWWIPGICTDGDNSAEDVGYGDPAIAAFERDTGISLGTGTTGRERFRRRHELLTGRYAYEWRNWRTLRMRASVEALQSVVRGGADDWTVYVSPGVRVKRDNPFSSLTSTPYQRDQYIRQGLADTCFDLSYYGAGAQTEVRMIPRIDYALPRGGFQEGIMTSRGVRDAFRANDAAYYNPVGLNERYNLTGGLKGAPWWWQRTNATVYEVKYRGAAAYSDFVDILGEYTPRILVHTWTDCNENTAHDAASRDFLSGFYATPVGEGVRYKGVTGADAHVYGGKLQLVNDTAWTLEAADGSQKLDPYAVRVLDVPRALSFAFEPDVAQRIRAELEALVADRAVIDRIRRDLADTLVACQRNGDLYRAEVLMSGWEVCSVRDRARRSTAALANQRLLERTLADTGVARINCGCLTNVVDEAGRIWLGDQVYTGFGAYGCEFVNMVDRGPIAIANTATPTPYRTEAGGQSVYYHIPVPDGSYKAVLHFAETWDKLPGRIMDVTVGGVTKKVIPWDAGGRYAASSVTWEGVKPSAGGTLDIHIVRGPAIVNGIEIFNGK